MDILMISSEAMPFASTGGLAGAVTSLSCALVDSGHNVKILLPRYYGISRDILKLLDSEFVISNQYRKIQTKLYTSTIKTPNDNNLDFYFLDLLFYPLQQTISIHDLRIF